MIENQLTVKVLPRGPHPHRIMEPAFIDSKESLRDARFDAGFRVGYEPSDGFDEHVILGSK